MPLYLKNVEFKNLEVGVRSIGATDIVAENLRFDNVGTPYDIAGAKSADIRGTRITNDPKLSSTGKRASLGWTKTNGPPLPAYCPSCKSIFPSKNYNFGGAYFNAWDNEETCQECRFEHARLSEGIFNLASETIKVLSAPDVTHLMIIALRKASSEVLKGAFESDKAATDLDLVNPQIATLFRKADEFGVAGLSLLLTLASLLYTAGSYELGKEQVRLAQEQVQLAKDANASSETAIARMLDSIKELHFTPKGVHPKSDPKSTCRPSTTPSTDEAAPKKTHSASGKRERKAKARDLRRQADRQRRIALCGTKKRID